ncbi:hypothetical protein BH23CHL8_BH23CHL8_20660 [soil metagenome]
MLVTGTIVAAAISGGVAWPLLLLSAAVLLPAAVARVLTALLRSTLLLALPLAVSVLLVNLFLFPGGRTILAELGPLRATTEGLAFALEVLARIAAMAGAAVLFSLTTRPADLSADLEHRGLSRRLTFVVHTAVTVLPRLAERAAAVAASQRARGLDTEGHLWRRIRGILPLAGPTVVGAIAEAEARTLALEARGFFGPGPRTLLWVPPDSGWQRLLRWATAVGVGVLATLRLAGMALP